MHSIIYGGALFLHFNTLTMMKRKSTALATQRERPMHSITVIQSKRRGFSTENVSMARTARVWLLWTLTVFAVSKGTLLASCFVPQPQQQSRLERRRLPSYRLLLSFSMIAPKKVSAPSWNNTTSSIQTPAGAKNNRRNGNKPAATNREPFTKREINNMTSVSQQDNNSKKFAQILEEMHKRVNGGENLTRK